MKWVTIISLIFLLSFTESKHLLRRSRDVGPSNSIGHCYSEIPEESFQDVALISFIHYVPKITFEDAEKLSKDITELGKKCAADEHAVPECAKSTDSLILEELCHEQNIAERYEFSECCGKVDQERHECLLSHKNATSESITPYQRPDAESSCKAFQEDRHAFHQHYIFKLAKKIKNANFMTLLHAAPKFGEVMVTCCQAEDKDACFTEKATAVKDEMKMFVLVEKQNCFLLKKFGAKHLQTMKLVQAAQKFPKADRPVLHNITREVVHIHEERCHGDMLESHYDQIALTKFICGHQDVISPKVSECCKRPLLERPYCLVTMDNDDPPADLSPTVQEFGDSREMCQHYAENQDDHMEGYDVELTTRGTKTHEEPDLPPTQSKKQEDERKMRMQKSLMVLYEYSRRHPELSPQLLNRFGTKYQEMLDKCCKIESTEECVSKEKPDLNKTFADAMEVIRTNCELYASLGDYKFKNALLVRYTKKAPQLSFEKLDQYAEQLRAVAAKCCQLGEDKKLVCAEGYTDLVLGSMCLEHQEHPINHKICQCCSNNYAFRRECFSAIEVDDGYVPAPCAPELFSFHEDLCTADADAEKRKPRLLVNLVKCKPTITGEQLKAIITDFYGLVGKCCQAENHEQCFQEEGPKLIERAQAALN